MIAFKPSLLGHQTVVLTLFGQKSFKKRVGSRILLAERLEETMPYAKFDAVTKFEKWVVKQQF